MIRSAIIALLLGTVPVGVRVHGSADWIMQGPDRKCCGPTDCHEVEPETVKYNPQAGAYDVEWRGKRHQVPESEAKKATVGFKPWVCEMPDRTIRCLFVPPMGS